MANMEKLVKAFEALKVFQQGSASPDESGQPTGPVIAPGVVGPAKKKETVITKKDRVSHLTIIADAMCTQTFRTMADFPKFLGISMETFLIACDDPEPDVRMSADECLNRTIKSLLETNLGRLQVELYKEIKKNGPSRSLRAALWRFADLAHLIRPQKCRPYVVNLVPCIQRITRRPEEAVQESLGTFMMKILPVLGSFTNDTEVKLLLKTFLPNLKSPSAATRRTAASSLSAICQHSRKPTMFYAWLINVLLGMVIPVHDDRKSPVLLGVMLSFRHVIPHLADQNHKDHSLKGSFGITRKEQETGVTTDQLIQIYELLLHYSQHIDHNVVTASLETLQQLLRTPPPTLLHVLLSPHGIKRKSIFTDSVHDGLPRQSTSDENLEGQSNRLPSVGGEDEAGLEELQDEAQQIDKSPGNQQENLVPETPNDDLLVTPQTPKESMYANAFPDDGEVILQQEEDMSSYSNVAIGETDDDASPGGDDDDVFDASGEGKNDSNENIMETTAPVSGINNSQQGNSSDIRVSVSPSMDRARTPDSNASATPKDTGSMEQLNILTHSRDNSSGSSSATLSSTARIREGDIGSYIDNNIPLIHCVRQMCASYLLTGYSKGLTPDRLVRVSVKGLAIACVGNALNLYPKVFFARLFNNDNSTEKKEDEQSIRDIVLYITHHDPQLRGNTALLIGQLIQAMLIESKYKPENGIKAACELFQTEPVSIESLVSLLITSLGDDLSGASRNLCAAIKICLQDLCNSVHGDLGLKLILALLPLSGNNYWLVKVKLLDVLASIDFRIVHFLENTFPEIRKGDHHFFGLLHLQERIVQHVLIKLLGDEDGRVRDASSKAIVKLVPLLFYDKDHPQYDPVIAAAKEHTCSNLDPQLHDQVPYTNTHTTAMKVISVFQDHTMTPAFSEESALSRVVDKLVKAMNSCRSRYLMYGCCHALCELSARYPVIQYASAWCCASITTLTPKDGSKPNRVYRQASRTFSSGSIASITSAGSTTSTVSLEELNTGSGGGALPLVLSLLTSSSLPLDLSAHQDALLLAANLMAGAAFKSLKTNNDKTEHAGSPEGLSHWSAFQDKALVPLADQLLQHLARLLNVCAHVIEGNQPGPPKIQPSLPSLPTGTSLSPIKKKTKGKEKESQDQTSLLSTSPSKSQPVEKHDGTDKDSKDMKSSKTQLGAFFHLPQYMRLYEGLKGADSNYKITLDLSGVEKFGGILRTALDALAQLLEFANFSEIGKYSEELLGFLKSSVQREPTATILTVQQLLKALFSTNLGSQWENSSTSSGTRKPGKATRLTSNMKPGLYHSCFTAPYTQFTQSLAAASIKPTAQTETEHDSSSWFSWMRKKSGDRRSSASKPSGKDKSHIHNYIRLFEPLVIKALKQYTITSSLTLQQQVLHLLAQLVQLRVNYCLLDSDQIFIGFVIKQFEFIEEGQIKESENLIPHIFHFLVLLSYERYHTKAIIGMPKIIQLCDGIMASGQQATTHAIPALRPIVHDLFVLRGSSKADSLKELDTQREVVISMLIRLIQYHEVLDMFTIVLQQHHRESEEKWKRLSRQVIDMVLPLLAKNQVNLDNQQGLDTLHRLFEAVASSALRPVDMLLKTLFMPLHDVSTLSNLQRWLSLVLAILRVVISQSKEEVILTRLQELRLQVNIFTYTHTQTARHDGKRSRHSSTTVGPGNGVAMPETPEEIFARFLLQVIGLMVTELSTRSCSPAPTEQSVTFLVKQLAHFLLYISHIFKSGSFRRVAGITMSMILSQPPDIYYNLCQLNSAFQSLIPTQPNITLQWCQLLLILSYTEETWWSCILQTPRRQSLTTKLSGNGILSEESEFGNQKYCCGEIVRKGGLILFCDYVCENLTDAEPMTWLIINHVNDIISLSHEPPVQDFISAIHRNSAASGLFIQALHLRCESFSTDPSMVKQTLRCLEPIHLSQSGALLTLLIDKFLKTYHHALARQCDMAACRRIEMLLAESVEECQSQIPVEDLDKLTQYMENSGLTKRYARLLSLLKRLKCYLNGEDIPVSSSPSDTQGFVAKANVNKEWYMSVVRECCFSQTSTARECSLMLHKLEYSDILTIMMTEEFDLSILEDCIALGVKKTRAAKKAVSTAWTIKRDSSTALAKKQDKQLARVDPLLQAAQLTLLRHINNIVNMLPTPHEVLGSVLNESSQQKYRTKLETFFKEPSWSEMVFNLAAALVKYLVSLPGLPLECFIPTDSQPYVGRFAVLCVEVISWYILQDMLPSSEHLSTALECLSKTLQNTQIFNIMGSKDNVSWVCSAIGCVNHIFTGVGVLAGESIELSPCQEPQNGEKEGDEFLAVIKACDLISELVECLQTHLSHGRLKNTLVPAFLAPTLRNLVVGLARLPLVNSYARTPHIVWKMGWMPTPGGELQTKLPPLPVEYLQDKEVLREFVYRVNVLGWTSRQQFEETWAALLGVLSAPPMMDEMSVEEDIERTQSSCLAVKAITALLIRTLMKPEAGNPTNSTYKVVTRHKELPFLQTPTGRKLSALRDEIEMDIKAMVAKRVDHTSQQEYLYRDDKPLLCFNQEREMGDFDYKLGQISIPSLGTQLNLPSPVAEVPQELEEGVFANISNAPGKLDIHSCLMFLLELYGQWMTPYATPKTPLMLLCETAKSVLSISDVFTEHAQYEWMFDTLLEVQKNHPVEDELLTQYIIPGICKAAAVLGMDSAISEKVSKLLEVTLRSVHLPCRIAALQGILYVLESNTIEDIGVFVPVVTEYLVKNLAPLAQINCVVSLKHMLAMLATSFYLIEHYVEHIKDMDFTYNIIQICVTMVSGSEEAISSAVYHAAIRGMERLVLARVLTTSECDAIVKASVDRLCMASTHRAMSALGLMLTCMYTAKEREQKKLESGNQSEPHTASHDPEKLLIAMERVTALFDRIRKGFPSEARVVARMLPTFLIDFFPAQDIMNKVIGEFLSSQQPHPQLMARVVFKVFSKLHQHGQTVLVRDWVMLSLSNFTQRTPVSMAIWSLTCFFISSSTNMWICALLPHVIGRMGKLENIDKRNFCVAALDFYNHQLVEEGGKRAFISIFQSVASPDGPYSELLAACTSP